MDKSDWKGAGRNEGPSGEDVRIDELTAEEIYDRHPREITVLLGWFITGHLVRLYKLFDGDMIQLLVLGEVAHHNISPFFSGNRMTGKSEAIQWNLDYPPDAMLPCNPFSISEATGIPRETCRRKVRELLDRGFLERHPKGGYVITPKAREHYREFNRETFARWLTTAREIEKFINLVQGK